MSDRPDFSDLKFATEDNFLTAEVRMYEKGGKVNYVLYYQANGSAAEIVSHLSNDWLPCAAIRFHEAGYTFRPVFDFYSNITASTGMNLTPQVNAEMRANAERYGMREILNMGVIEQPVLVIVKAPLVKFLLTIMGIGLGAMGVKIKTLSSPVELENLLGVAVATA